MRDGGILDTKAGEVLVIAGLAWLLLPSLFRELGSLIGQAGTGIASVADAAANAVIGSAMGTEYVGGGNVSYSDLMDLFGQSCANAITSGGSFDQLIACPSGWQDTLKNMNANTGGFTSQ